MATNARRGRRSVARRRDRSAIDVGVKALRERLGLNQALFARLAGYSVRTIAAWESGGKTLGPTNRRQMTELLRLHQALAKVVQREFIGDWLTTPNSAFSWLKPLEVAERGEIDRLWRMIYELESGSPT